MLWQQVETLRELRQQYQHLLFSFECCEVKEVSVDQLRVTLACYFLLNVDARIASQRYVLLLPCYFLLNVEIDTDTGEPWWACECCLLFSFECWLCRVEKAYCAAKQTCYFLLNVDGGEGFSSCCPREGKPCYFLLNVDRLGADTQWLVQILRLAIFFWMLTDIGFSFLKVANLTTCYFLLNVELQRLWDRGAWAWHYLAIFFWMLNHWWDYDRGRVCTRENLLFSFECW